MEPTTSLRDSIESALGDADPTAVASESTYDASIEPTIEPDDAGAPAADTGSDLNALSEEPAQPRDEQGKFAQSEMTPGPKSGPKQQGERAPASWRPEVRDHWATLPEPVRAEVARREQEVQRTLQETSEARKYAEAFSKTIAPYEAYIRAENSNPIQAIDNLMATAVRLRTGTAPELAQLVAGMVQQFGTGRFGPQFVEMLDSALAGAAPTQGNQQQAQMQQVIQQQLAPVQQFMSQFQQAQAMQQQQFAEKASQEVNGFLNQTEFGHDVKQEMADLMEVAQRRGQELTLQDAYRQACMMNPSVRSALQSRANAKSAQTQANVAQRARAAAVSVSSSGAPMGAPKVQSDNVRDAIEAAIAMNSR